MSRFRALMSAVLVVPLAVGSAAVARASEPSAAVAPATGAAIRVVNQATNDITYDPAHRAIVASVPSRVGLKGNSIVGINPATGQVSPSVFVGSEPNRLALSDDGSTLYVGLDGAAAVRVVDMTTLTPGLQFSLGSDPFLGPFYPEDIEVLPGAAGSVAVSRRNLGFSPRHEGVAIYDDGVQRPTTTPGHTGSNVIEFSDSSSTLYGYNNETTEFGLRTMSVTPSGVTVVNTASGLITGFGVDIEFDHGNDLLYATSGRVVDPATSQIMGTIGATGPVEPDSARGIVFYLTGSAPTLTLRAFDVDTFVPVAALPINGVSGSPGSLIRWGRNGLAFRTTGDQVFLITPGPAFEN